jgi:hypothetical protein
LRKLFLDLDTAGCAKNVTSCIRMCISAFTAAIPNNFAARQWVPDQDIEGSSGSMPHGWTHNAFLRIICSVIGE